LWRRRCWLCPGKMKTWWIAHLDLMPIPQQHQEALLVWPPKNFPPQNHRFHFPSYESSIPKKCLSGLAPAVELCVCHCPVPETALRQSFDPAATFGRFGTTFFLSHLAHAHG
jgi:hypothetical protein